jgi:hypothetical protein
MVSHRPPAGREELTDRLVAALVVATRRPGRPLPVLGLLALAGLLRPEAWLLSGLYALYCGAATARWSRRAALVGGVLASPLIWMAIDLAVTGDPFWSLSGTADFAAALNRRTGIGQAPDAFLDGLHDLAG